MAVRVLIVDEHAVLRSGLRMLLESQPDMKVVGEASDGESALAMARDASPDVITLDPTGGDADRMEFIRTLRRECPEARILVVTMHDDPRFFGEVMLAGGSGYVVKQAGELEVLAAVRAVSQGRAFVSLTLTEEFVKAVTDRPGGRLRPKAGAHADLSQREAEVLSLVAQGYTSQQVASNLYLSAKTIETYRSRLSKKLGLKDRADLVRFAVQAGLFDSSSLTEKAHATLNTAACDASRSRNISELIPHQAVRGGMPEENPQAARRNSRIIAARRSLGATTTTSPERAL